MADESTQDDVAGDPAAPKARRALPRAIPVAGLVLAVLAFWAVAHRAGRGSPSPHTTTPATQATRATSAAVAGAHADIVRSLQAKRRTADSKAVREACAGEREGSCACRQTATERALNRDLHALALGMLAGADDACKRNTKTRGMEAEALARAGRTKEAIAKANATLEADDANPFATYAQAHVSYQTGNLAIAVKLAQRAIKRGRGATAHLLLGVMAFRNKEYKVARDNYNKILELDPREVDAHFNLAILSAAEGEVGAAREGYLEVLRLDPRHLDARNNLALLTHSAGATASAPSTTPAPPPAASATSR